MPPALPRTGFGVTTTHPLAELSRTLLGEAEMAGNPPPATPVTEPLFVRRAIDLVRKNGTTQMAPSTQPRDAFIFGSVGGALFEGAHFYVTIL